MPNLFRIVHYTINTATIPLSIFDKCGELLNITFVIDLSQENQLREDFGLDSVKVSYCLLTYLYTHYCAALRAACFFSKKIIFTSIKSMAFIGSFGFPYVKIITIIEGHIRITGQNS